MQNVLLVVQLILAVALVAVILVQRTAQDGGGLTGGGSTMGGLFTARGSANLLTRITAVLATLFIVNSLALGMMASASHKSGSLLDQIEPVSVPAEGEKATDAGKADKAAKTDKKGSESKKPLEEKSKKKAPEAPKGLPAPEVPLAK